MLQLLFNLTVFLYLTIISIRVVMVGLYNFTGNDPLKEVAYNNFFPIAFSFFEVLCLYWNIWHPRKMLEKTAELASGH